jgi:hypothetical protein
MGSSSIRPSVSRRILPTHSPTPREQETGRGVVALVTDQGQPEGAGDRSEAGVDEGDGRGGQKRWAEVFDGLGLAHRQEARHIEQPCDLHADRRGGRLEGGRLSQRRVRCHEHNQRDGQHESKRSAHELDRRH